MFCKYPHIDASPTTSFESKKDQNSSTFPLLAMNLCKHHSHLIPVTFFFIMIISNSLLVGLYKPSFAVNIPFFFSTPAST